MSELLFPIALAATFVSVSLVGVAVQMSLVERRRAVRLLEAEVGQITNLREEHLTRSFGERALLPVLSGLRTAGQRLTPAAMRRRIAHKLILAGSPVGWDAERIAALKVLAAAAGVAGGIAIAALVGWAGIRTIGLTVLLGSIGFLVPDGVVDAMAAKRREAIRRSLADTMDLLTISVEAGLSFDAALALVAESAPGPLALEIGRALQEVRLGVSRVDALRHLSDRVDVDEMRSFVLAVVQAETFGISTVKVLRAQSKELRVKRRQHAELKSMQIPVKILFPVIFCILPSLFVVILGPGAIQIIDQIFGVG